MNSYEIRFFSQKPQCENVKTKKYLGKSLPSLYLHSFLIIMYIECVIPEKCHDNAVPYKLISGEGMEKFPVICLNGKL